MSENEKLDLLLSKMTQVENKMGAFEERMGSFEERMGRVEERMATKEEVKEIKENMVTKGYLSTKIRELENNILREVDTVQEKSNAHYEELKKQIITVRDSFQARDIEAIRTRLCVVESDVANLKRKVGLVHV